MDISCFDNKILIIKDNAKDSLLKLISNKLFNIKIITLSELKKKYFFDYDKETIYYICNKYNVIPAIARIYLENLYYLDDIKDDKVKFLCELKSDLESNNLLIKNELFRVFIEKSDVVLFDLKNIDKFYNRIFDNIKSISRYELKEYNDKKKLVVCNNRSEEIAYVASEICSLIKSGVDINDIKLANVSSEYDYLIKTIFKMFNININLKSSESIKGTRIVKVFKENYDKGINESLDEVKNIIRSKEDNEVYKQIINIINSYSFISDYSLVKNYIFDDIDNTKIKAVKYKNAISVVDIESEIIYDNEYVFLINYTEKSLPHNHKDEDYLSDKTKSQLNLSMSYELNNNSLMSLISAIKRIKNIVITFPSHDIKDELYISSSYNPDIFEKENSNISFEHSNLFNKLKFVSMLDENKKYGTVSEELLTLNNHYKNFNYLLYDNKYKRIDHRKLYDYFGKELTLSYSSLNKYNSCSFRYYLDYVLKINKYEDSFDATIGNIFHAVLSECFNDSFDFEKSYNDKINNSKYEFSNADKFFLGKLKADLQLIIETIKNQLKYTQFDKFMYEKKIKIKVNEELNITFEGYIDKLMYKEFDDYTVVVIVDYKTGDPKLSLNNIVYGLDMQLPIYVYLVKNSNIINNVKIGGLYLQKILGKAKTTEDKIKDLKLLGYTNSDTNVLECVDSSYKDSKIIYGLKVKNDGDFNANSKMLSDDNIDYLCDLVNDKINESSRKILNAEFDINPKMINKENKGCMYCKYIDICYMKNEDIVNLQSPSKLFGGEDDE